MWNNRFVHEAYFFGLIFSLTDDMTGRGELSYPSALASRDSSLD